MKPDWKDAPEKAMFLAQDEDGTWFWFQSKPELYRGSWYASGQAWRCYPLPVQVEATLESRP